MTSASEIEDDSALGDTSGDPYALAQHFARRPGYSLVCVRKAALPIARVTCRISTIVRSPLPRISEFVLRSLDAGLDQAKDISAFLGISDTVLTAALQDLATAELIAVRPAQLPNERRISLLERGRSAVAQATMVRPEDHSVVVFIDRVLGAPTSVGRAGQWLLKPKQIKEQQLLELPSRASRKIECSDIQPRDLQHLIERVGAGRAIRHAGRIEAVDVLSVRAIEKREAFFRPCQALLFRSTEGARFLLSVIADGIRLEQHEEVLSADPAYKFLLRNVEGAREAWKSAADGIVSAQELACVSPQGPSVPHTATDSLLKPSARSAPVLSSLTKPPESLSVADSPSQEGDTIECLGTMDHPPLLVSSLSESRQRLLIISPWIRSAVVNRDFLRRLLLLLQRRVRVFIGYGMKPEPGKPDGNDAGAIAGLSDLVRKFPAQLAFARLENTHSKVLIRDSDLLAVTSFNWLSFRGDPDRTFRDETGILVRRSSTIESEFQRRSTEIQDRLKK